MVYLHLSSFPAVYVCEHAHQSFDPDDGFLFSFPRILFHKTPVCEKVWNTEFVFKKKRKEEKKKKDRKEKEKKKEKKKKKGGKKMHAQILMAFYYIIWLTVSAI